MWIFGFNKIVYYGYDVFYLFDKGREVCILLYKILIFVEYIIIKNVVVIVFRGCVSVILFYES